jgi:hypothetical protein
MGEFRMAFAVMLQTEALSITYQTARNNEMK